MRPPSRPPSGTIADRVPGCSSRCRCSAPPSCCSAGRRTDRWGHWLAVALSWAAFVWGALLFLDLRSLEPEQRPATCTCSPGCRPGRQSGFTVDAGLLLDPLSVAFVLLVTFVGSLIHVYSVSPTWSTTPTGAGSSPTSTCSSPRCCCWSSRTPTCCCTSAGRASVSPSYLLIGFWNHNPVYAAAAKKAFVVNRVGDVGLLDRDHDHVRRRSAPCPSPASCRTRTRASRGHCSP